MKRTFPNLTLIHNLTTLLLHIYNHNSTILLYTLNYTTLHRTTLLLKPQLLLIPQHIPIALSIACELNDDTVEKAQHQYQHPLPIVI